MIMEKEDKTIYTNEFRWLRRKYFKKNWLGKRVFSHSTIALQQKTINNNTISWIEPPVEVVDKII